MSDDLTESVETFLSDTQTVLREYDQGYMDADAALSVLEGHIDDLREDFEG
ncbi:hypothetical protein [Salinirubrum litoreum]|uniref:Uncharacterized protein n=1 Tax=Salinirubrum litoreum TaxID=1126234 RepID=A0ABD5RAI9_9EURY|nr:hypothetical protein [Salinirubrum litoreum]